MSVSDDTGTTGRVITFYSYKGGTGRTMALANVAWLLASNGYKVLTIDWDLESPGLHRYFHPFLKDKDLRNSEGILDLVRNYAKATLRPTTSTQELQAMVHIQEYAASLDFDFPQGGLLDFVPAGRQDVGYAEAVSTFDWDTFWRERQGGQLLQVLREDMLRNYDFVLIDSRTGTSDTAGICTIQLPDTVVNCFTLNTQSIDGAAAITGSILKQAPDMTVYPVPTRIEDGEKAKLERGRAYSRRQFEPFMTFLGGGNANAYWNAAEVPYIPYYAYEEILAVFGDTPQQNGRLLARYVRLATLIAKHDCPAAPIPDAERSRVLSAFEQSVPRDRRTVVVAYAPLDRIWAEWLRDRLSGPANQVILHSIRDSLPDLAKADRLIIVFSREFVARDRGKRLLPIARERIAGGDANFVVALRVDSTVVDQRIPSRALVDVMGVDEERALEMMFSALALDSQVRAEARAVTIRYPAGLAPYWNIKLNRNPRFSGRGRLLESMRDQLLSSGSDGGRLALIGLPGVGKTQTALEYVYRFAASYDVVWWVSATQPAWVRVALADLASELKLPAGNVEEQVAAVLEALRRATPVRRWLVVFDNVDVPGDFAELLPVGPGHVLVTSRNPQWSSDLQTIDVKVFERKESVELLTRRVPTIDAADADTLAARLGDLPLALEQAGGWLASTSMTVPDYLSLLDNSAVRAMEESATDDSSETIASTVTVAYEELSQRSPAAARLLELFAFMAPEAIPYRMISNKQLTALLAPIDQRMYDPTRHGSLIREIGRWGLARVDAGNGGVVVHRLTQDIIGMRLTAEQQAERRREIQSVLAEADRGNPENPDNWPVYEGIRPHLEATGAFSAERPEIRQMILDMARYLWWRGDYAGCGELGRAVLDEWLPRFGPDDTWVLRLRYSLAGALRDQGHEAEAFEMNRDIYERFSRTLGKDDPYTLNAALTLAADLRGRGDYHEAVELDEQTVRGLREAFGDDDPLTLSAVNNLGVSKRLVGDFREAARLDRDCLERRRTGLGTSDIATIGSQENLGTDLREIGDLGPSRNQFEEAYRLARARYGDGLMRVLRLANGYAVTLRRLHDLDAAAKIIDEVTERANTLLGSRHRVTLSCRLEQAAVRWAQGRYEEAHKAGEEVYADYRELRGYHHPDTLAAGNDLAIFRRAAGDVEGALRLAEKTHERLEGFLLSRHPHTLISMVTLANAQFASGLRSAARETDETVLGRMRKFLREGHPATLAATVNWAVSHRSEDEDAATRKQGEALEGFRAAFGDDHPYTQAAREWRRLDLDIAPIPI